jgi:hypothetical protein
MWNFFWYTVILGFLKWIHAVFIKKDVTTLDTIALVYAIVLFIIMCFCKPDESKPIETPPIKRIIKNSELKKLQEKDRKWRESLGTGILDSI